MLHKIVVSASNTKWPKLLSTATIQSTVIIAMALPVFFSVIAPTLSYALPGHPTSSAPISSARRLKGVPAQFYIQQALEHQKWHAFTGSSTVLNSKSAFDQANWSIVPALSASQLQSSFEAARNERPFQDHRSRARRATWLYPDDGCFVRAVVADKVLREQFSIADSAKIFAFGNLRVETENSPEKAVEWWYHVAAIAKVQTSTGEEIYVFDPAIDLKGPIPVKDWLSKMSDTNLEIAICKGAAYDPYSNCQGDSGDLVNSVNRAFREASWYLPSEWERVLELGRDPRQELLQ